MRQVCGGYPDAMARCAQLLEERVDVDFVDINSGCPIDLICNKCAAVPPRPCATAHPSPETCGRVAGVDRGCHMLTCGTSH